MADAGFPVDADGRLSVHPRLSINLLSLAPAPFAQQVETVTRIGAQALTPDVGQLDGLTATQATRVMHDAGLRAAALTHRAFSFSDATETKAAQDRLARSIDYANKIGAPVIVLTTGGRGKLSWSEAAKRFAEAMDPGAALAQAAGISLGIEPTSHLYADASLVHRLSDCTALARASGIAVTVDLFACWADSDIETALVEAAPLTALTQISDYVYGDRGLPCRAVPGDGAIPLDRLLPALVQSGFTGGFDLEIIGPRLQAEGEEVGLHRAAAAVGAILDKANG